MMITLPTSSMASLKHFLREHRDLMFRYIVREVSKSMETGSYQVNLFQFGETSLIAAVRKPQFGVVLQQAMDFFKIKELYEDAAQCRDLLRQVYHDTDVQAVEALLTETDTPPAAKK